MHLEEQASAFEEGLVGGDGLAGIGTTDWVYFELLIALSRAGKNTLFVMPVLLY